MNRSAYLAVSSLLVFSCVSINAQDTTIRKSHGPLSSELAESWLNSSVSHGLTESQISSFVDSATGNAIQRCELFSIILPAVTADEVFLGEFSDESPESSACSRDALDSNIASLKDLALKLSKLKAVTSELRTASLHFSRRSSSEAALCSLLAAAFLESLVRENENTADVQALFECVAGFDNVPERTLQLLMQLRTTAYIRDAAGKSVPQLAMVPRDIVSAIATGISRGKHKTHSIPKWCFVPPGDPELFYELAMVVDDSNIDITRSIELRPSQRDIFNAFRKGEAKSFSRKLRSDLFRVAFNDALIAFGEGDNADSLLSASMDLGLKALGSDDLELASRAMVFFADFSRVAENQNVNLSLPPGFDQIRKTAKPIFAERVSVFGVDIVNEYALCQKLHVLCLEAMASQE
ncbi:hypothetical protein K227x_58670 [Rubripirellula lacrimiformis]|uniref:Uncharacterized protein n=1 Tax=Rubripirellula lacrimiformis TaxID=1930273 RepID=A0A517NJZ3_9BACT|nr:hypothetical protein [Rubripirellula lacrimiformis]QDT07440.1 hypothetical protein K227x_58670 [Rubripirellula lacrimiformis]